MLSFKSHSIQDYGFLTSEITHPAKRSRALTLTSDEADTCESIL